MAIELSADERLKITEENTWSGQQVSGATQWPVVAGGHGIYIVDTDGKEYIDATSGLFCTSLGHGHKKVLQAIKDQVDIIQNPKPLQCDVTSRLIQRIAELAPGDLNRVSLGFTGSDANEIALEIARSYFAIQGKKQYGNSTMAGIPRHNARGS